ncbi:hypothetical protein ACGFT2_32040 [Streptomyces sp. NPDC048514]|uniref:hypothetical protein n=1 Tax=Streptomyces sp. NPDC048514 TaxID=3365564 RepID=UPI0037216EAB
MGRRGGLRAGAVFLAAGLALPALLCATGCDRSGGPRHTAPAHTPDPGTPAAGTPPAASPVADADLCTRLVAHWAREVLDSGTYGDYQSMGLSNGQYEILRGVVDAARGVRRRQGIARAEELIARQARAACTERYRHGAPSGGPWR